MPIMEELEDEFAELGERAVANAQAMSIAMQGRPMTRTELLCAMLICFSITLAVCVVIMCCISWCF